MPSKVLEYLVEALGQVLKHWFVLINKLTAQSGGQNTLDFSLFVANGQGLICSRSAENQQAKRRRNGMEHGYR